MKELINDKTKDLENYVKSILLKVERKIYKKAIIKFQNEKGEGLSGIFAYEDEGQYYFVNCDRGDILSKRVTNDINEIIYWCLDQEIYVFTFRNAIKKGYKGKKIYKAIRKREEKIFSIVGGEILNKRNNCKTKILEHRVKVEVVKINPKIWEEESVRFYDEIKGSRDGIFAYEREGQYYLVKAERGKVYEIREAIDINEIIDWCLHIYTRY